MTKKTIHLVHPDYRPEIDGLRAIAVLSVVIYHVFPDVLPGGYVGVDIFFVISGFLISTIILGSLESGKFSFLEFYAKRIKRIFPALILVMAASILFGWIVLYEHEFRQLGKHIAAGAGFISNFILWLEVGYFDVVAEKKPLLHLWSLGIEEQFYIFWPLLLGLFWRKNKNTFLIILGIALMSFTMNIYLMKIRPDAGFYLPFGRIWELMVGGILAFYNLHFSHQKWGNPAVLSVTALSGLVIILLSVLLLSKNILFPGWYALLPVTGAALIIIAGQENPVNRIVMSNRVLVFVGLISYPLYLWHWPILSFTRIIIDREIEINLGLIVIILSLLLSSLTYVMVEKRFKHGYNKFDIGVLSSLMLVMFITGLYIWKGEGSPRQNGDDLEKVVSAVGDWEFPGQLKPLRVNKQVFYAIGKQDTSILFIGDSHMEQYGPGVSSLVIRNPQYRKAVFATKLSCPPIAGLVEKNRKRCRGLHAEVDRFIHHKDVKVVVIAAAWNSIFLGRVNLSEGSLPELSRLKDENIRLKFNILRKKLEELTKSKKVFLVLDIPTGKKFSPEYYLGKSRISNSRVYEILEGGYKVPYSEEQKLLAKKMKDIAMSVGVEVIEPAKYLCINNQCIVSTVDGKPVYQDDSHLRPFFVKENVDYMQRVFY